jgi:hypothetical protein
MTAQSYPAAGIVYLRPDKPNTMKPCNRQDKTGIFAVD